MLFNFWSFEGQVKMSEEERYIDNQDEISREIEEFEDRELYMGESEISVSLTSFMTAVVFFFAGLLLTGSSDLQIRLRIPLLLLFISAFGFLYSALIYANASGEVARLNKNKFHRQMSAGNILSEYLGVYCLVFAIPIAVLGYSSDKIFSIIVLIVSVMGFVFYHILGYSILERYFDKPYIYFILLFMIGSQTSCFYFFYIEKMIEHYFSSALLILSILGVLIYSLGKEEI